MQYLSTRDSALRVSAQEAIVRGLAPQSGLFVPETFPQADLDAWKNLSYPELAEKVLAGFLTDYSADILHTATASTYGAAFGGKAGETVNLTFDFARRANISLQHGIEVLWNGERVFASEGDASSWQSNPGRTGAAPFWRPWPYPTRTCPSAPRAWRSHATATPCPSPRRVCWGF